MSYRDRSNDRKTAGETTDLLKQLGHENCWSKETRQVKTGRIEGGSCSEDFGEEGANINCAGHVQ